MRRGFSILLILFFGLGPFSALLAGSEDANLPLCCRRNGAHHCAMNARMAAMMAKMERGAGPVLTAPLTCPDYPGAAGAFSAPPTALAVAASALPVPIALAHVAITAITAPRSLPALAHAGRGPPAANLS
jgi:hypothetical protein